MGQLAVEWQDGLKVQARGSLLVGMAFSEPPLRLG